MIRAAVEASPGIVEDLLAAGVSVDQQDRAGNTALMRAVEYNRPKIIDLLLVNGANLRLRNALGQNAEDIARIAGNPALARHVAVSLFDPTGASLDLFAAAETGDRAGMLAAVARRGDLLWRDASGRGLLQVALDARQIETIGFLASVRKWKQTGIIHDTDPKLLVSEALIQTPNSAAANFYGDALITLLDSAVIAPTQIMDAFAEVSGDRDVKISTVRQVLSGLGWSVNEVEMHFSPPPPSLPDLEYALPFLTPSDGASREEWRKVQRILAEEGLYSGAIDGLPGQGTFDAIYAYIVPLIPIIIRRARAAADRADTSVDPAFGPSELRSRNGTQLQLMGQRINSYGTHLPIGYTTHAFTPRGDVTHRYLVWRVLSRQTGHTGNTHGFFSVTCRENGTFKVLRFTVLGQLVIAEDNLEELTLYSDSARTFKIPNAAPAIGC